MAFNLLCSSSLPILLVVCALTRTSEGALVGNLQGAHLISGNFHIIDSNTILLENFNYDGAAPGAFLYYYGPGVTVDRLGGGFYIPLPPPAGQTSGSSQGALQRRQFINEDIMVTLPNGVDACDIGNITIWCEPFKVIFAQLEVPRSTFLNNGNDPCTLANPGTPIVPSGPEFDNCKVLDDTLQLSWRVDNDNSQVRFQLCGCTASTTQYLGFGLSGSDRQTLMLGADATIAWVDDNGMAQAQDYFLGNYVQCRNGAGVCPDTVDTTTGRTCANDVSDVTGFVKDGQQCISFMRPINPTDSGSCDRPIDLTNQNQYIVWGIGSLGETAFKHHTRATMNDDPIHLGRAPLDECGGIELMCQQCDPFPSDRIITRQDTTFEVVIGPSANPRGYTAITGQAGWGIAWYINGSLIPELVVERGRTYTFLISGGDNPLDGANYHPFYITDSINGGRLLNTQEQRMGETVFAGFNNNDVETAVGPLCELMETTTSGVIRQTCGTYDNYISSFDLMCVSGTPGTLVWTPDENTPDIVYYQCAAHLNLGYAIQVINQGNPVPPSLTSISQTDGSPSFKISGVVEWMGILLLALLATVCTIRL